MIACATARVTTSASVTLRLAFLALLGRRSSAVQNTAMRSKSRSASIVAPRGRRRTETPPTSTTPQSTPPTTTRRGITHLAARLRVLRGVAVVEHEHVAVGVAEVGHVADAAVDGVHLELDALGLELRARRLDVVDVERDRQAVVGELDAEGVRLHDRERQGARLVLRGGHVPPALAERQAERLAVERGGALEVLGGDADEVGAGDVHVGRHVRSM